MDRSLTEAGNRDRLERGADRSLDVLTRAEVERVARASYGRLLAILASADGDLASAEDCLADAFARALSVWPLTGVPQSPEAWLLTVARNRRRDGRRSASYRLDTAIEDLVAHAGTLAGDECEEEFPDRRLALLFVCAHPAIEPGIRAPLMLQTVLRVEAERIAAAFSVPATTMAQRLVRAKRRIRDARIPFVIPEQSEMPARVAAVLEAVYAAYAIDWQIVAGPSLRDSLAVEAHFLSKTLADLLPEEPEVLGLAALLSLSLARAEARQSAEEFVPLHAQDASTWDERLIHQGESYLRRAFAMGRIGRFQLEAAIQSAHCASRNGGGADLNALRKLYEGLIAVAPTLGARTALAATVGQIEGPEAGLRELDSIVHPGIARFRPAWATRAHLLAAARRHTEACEAFDKAISLTTEPKLRAYLLARQRRSANDIAGNRSLPETP